MAAAAEVAAEHVQLAQWLAWVRQLPWTQADLLHVMEELEPRATRALRSYLTLRAGLAASLAELRDRLDDAMPADTARLHGALFAGTEGLPTVEAARTAVAAAHADPSDPARQKALNRFGHRGPGEMRPDAVRWRENAEQLDRLAALTPLRTPQAVAAQRQAAEAEIEAKLQGRHRPFTETLRRARDLARTADLAWDGLAIVMTVAQRWVQAAAVEALAAQLISQPEEVLYLELEELKQIATGEWHRGDADQVQAEVTQRQAMLAAVGAPTPIADRPTPIYPGQARGPAHFGKPAADLPPPAAIWLAESADPGCAAFWIAAGGVVSAAVDPCAPGLLAARALALPAAAGAASLVSSARHGQQIALDGTIGQAAVV